MDGAEPDREALLRRAVRKAIADCRLFGIPDHMLRHKNLLELRQLAHDAARTMMGAPKSAA